MYHRVAAFVLGLGLGLFGCSLLTSLDGLTGPAPAGGAVDGGGTDTPDPDADPSITSEAATTEASGTPSTYADIVRAAQPTAYWRLGESIPPLARDESTNHHDGTYMGGVTLGVPGALCGAPDTAASFDGDDDAVVMGDVLDFAGTEPFTIELFVKPRDAGHGGFIGKNSLPTGTHRGYFLTLFESSPGATLIRYGRGDGSFIDTANGPAPVPGVWSHLVATWDGVTRVVYINGVQGASRSSTVVLEDSNDPLRLGSIPGWTTFRGELDEVAVYARVLSVTEISAHVKASACSQQ